MGRDSTEMEVDLMLLMEIVDFMVVTVDFMVKIMEDGKMLIMKMDQDFMEGLVGIGAQMVEGLIQMQMVIGAASQDNLMQMMVDVLMLRMVMTVGFMGDQRAVVQMVMMTLEVVEIGSKF